MNLRVALAPDVVTAVVHDKPGAGVTRRQRLTDAVRSAGAVVVPPENAEALIWLEVGDASPLIEILDSNPQILWVQLCWAGVDPLLGTGLFDRPVAFTCAKGTFGQETAEQALALTVGCLRHHVAIARTHGWNWIEHPSLFGRSVTILGGGDTATNLVRLLAPFGCSIRIIRRSPELIEGVDEVLTLDSLHDVLPTTDVLILALSLTEETRGLIGADELGLLPPHATVVNVARGAHIDTPALVDALESGRLFAAGLDVTDPEPLPDDHPLWSLDNVLITSHSSNAVDFSTDVLARRVHDNVTRFREGRKLLGQVDVVAGY